MKQKTETITVAVEMAITYDPTCKGAREEVIKCAVRELPNDLVGACIHHRCYSIKRGRKYLVPNVKVSRCGENVAAPSNQSSNL